jgi:HK97 family phage major capsid protein
MPELNAVIEQLGTSFEAFKAENDKRLAEIEKKGSVDVVLAEKVDRINADLGELNKMKAQIDSIEASAGRLQGGGNPELNKAKQAHTEAFNQFFRKGVDGGLRDLEVQAALTTNSDPDGGYLVPEETDMEINRVLATVSSMRMLARVQPVGSATYKKLHNAGGSTSGWVGEEEARTETDTPVLKQMDFPTMELYANPAATQSMLDDGMFDIESWLANEVSVEFAEEEGAAFITGNGIKKPRGILGYTAVANASYAWGSVGYVASGASGAFVAAPNGGDCLISLQHALKSGYRNNGTFMMNDLTFEAVRKLKDSNGAYLWRPGLESGSSDTLLGKPVSVDDNMPDIAANSYSIAFGDFQRGYIITDRSGARVLRDPYTNKPFVHFYTTKRVGGGIQDFAAIKLLKFA